MNFLNSLFNFIQSATYQYFSFNIYVTGLSRIFIQHLDTEAREKVRPKSSAVKGSPAPAAH